MSRRSVIAVVAGAALVAGAATVVHAQDASAGKAVYEGNKCGNCHGAQGAGDGAMSPKLKDKPSNWAAAGGGGLKGMEDQQIADAIKKGGAAIGKSKLMPKYEKLSDKELTDVVAYVKSLKK
jgi:mono/diheme cytochrome c family protein